MSGLAEHRFGTTPFGLFDYGKIKVPPQCVWKSGDIYAVISDGIFEAADPSDEEFGVESSRNAAIGIP